MKNLQELLYKRTGKLLVNNICYGSDPSKESKLFRNLALSATSANLLVEYGQDYMDHFLYKMSGENLLISASDLLNKCHVKYEAQDISGPTFEVIINKTGDNYQLVKSNLAASVEHFITGFTTILFDEAKKYKQVEGEIVFNDLNLPEESALKMATRNLLLKQGHSFKQATTVTSASVTDVLNLLLDLEVQVTPPSELEALAYKELLMLTSEGKIKGDVPSSTQLHIPRHGAFRAVMAKLVLDSVITLPRPAKLGAIDILAGIMLDNGKDYYTGDKPYFISMPYAMRRRIVSLLLTAKDFKEEILAKDNNAWKRLFHTLHISQHIKGNEEANLLVHKVRNDETRTFESKFEEAIETTDTEEAIALASRRPVFFARSLMRLITVLPSEPVLLSFKDIVDKVPTEVIIPLLGEANRCHSGLPSVTMPNSHSSMINVRPFKEVIGGRFIIALMNILHDELVSRIKPGLLDSDELRIVPGLETILFESGGKSKNESMKTMTRGSSYPCPALDNDILTLFLYWVGNDVDLSATFLDSNMEPMGHSTYSILETADIAVHSKDIRFAPKGGAEYINIDLNKARARGVRHVLLHGIDFNGQGFDAIKDSCLGWMKSESINSTDGLTPKIEQSVEINSPHKNILVARFDLETNMVQWLDIPDPDSADRSNIDVARQSQIETVKTLNVLKDICDVKVTVGNIMDMLSIAGVAINVGDDSDRIGPDTSTTDIIKTCFVR